MLYYFEFFYLNGLLFGSYVLNIFNFYLSFSTRRRMASNKNILALPSNFREMSICPQPHELLDYDQKPFLRKNILFGRFDEVENYLDIHFRLLRENFIRPLRANILKHIHSGNETESATAAKNDKRLNVYRNVRILDGGADVRTCAYDCTPFRNFDWEVINSKVVKCTCTDKN